MQLLERQFKSLVDMERAYYGDINAETIKKSKDAVLSTDTGYWHKVLGAKIWSKINYEANAFAGLPKEPWVKSAYRMETAAGDSFPSGGLAEGTASNFTDVADTTHPTIATITVPPKLIDHGWGMTWKMYMLGGVDDTINAAAMRAQKGRSHARAIGAMLVCDVDTAASNNMESLDRVASSSAESGHCNTASDPDIYGLDRSGATTYDAQVSSSGSATSHLRDLSLPLIDGVWNSVTKVGGQPSVIFTGYNTVKVWASLLEAERRFAAMQVGVFRPRYGEASGFTPGVEAGFSVSSYFNVPIIPCQDYDSSRASSRTNEVAPITMIDDRFVRIGVRMPTVYSESRYPEDAINLNGHGIEGHYYTIGELRCYNFAAQGKLTDIK